MAVSDSEFSLREPRRPIRCGRSSACGRRGASRCASRRRRPTAPSARPQQPFLTRAFAAREAALGIGGLLAGDRAARRRWFVATMAGDAADGVAAVVGLRTGELCAPDGRAVGGVRLGLAGAVRGRPAPRGAGPAALTRLRGCRGTRGQRLRRGPPRCRARRCGSSRPPGPEPVRSAGGPWRVAAAPRTRGCGPCRAPRTTTAPRRPSRGRGARCRGTCPGAPGRRRRAWRPAAIGPERPAPPRRPRRRGRCRPTSSTRPFGLNTAVAFAPLVLGPAHAVAPRPGALLGLADAAQQALGRVAEAHLPEALAREAVVGAAARRGRGRRSRAPTCPGRPPRSATCRRGSWARRACRPR